MESHFLACFLVTSISDKSCCFVLSLIHMKVLLALIFLFSFYRSREPASQNSYPLVSEDDFHMQPDTLQIKPVSERLLSNE